MSGPFVVIASYPKSGNTWVRLFLDCLARSGEPPSINTLGHAYYGPARRNLFDAHAPAPASELRDDEIDAFLPGVWRAVAADAEHPAVIKMHDRARRTRDGDWLMPTETVHSVVLLTRHPFDVAISYARHLGIAPAGAVEHLCDKAHRTAAPEAHLPLPLAEAPGAWDAHATSWLDGPYPVTAIRYEDLCADPMTHFRRLVAGAGLRVSRQALTAAVGATEFAALSSEERRAGFRERPASSPAFFREGRPGAGVRELDADLRERLVAALGPTMARFGYLANGSVLAFPARS